MTLQAGQQLGPYQIIAAIGAGGMGEVYRARDTRLKREVAVKVLPDRLARDPFTLGRFQREAQAVAALSHPNILAIHDVGMEGTVSYVVLELLEGETLRDRIRRTAMPWRKAVEIGAAIADGLAAAHGKGIIHRDLKPENVFLTLDGGVKILDFGLARLTEAPPPGGPLDSLTETRTTEPGAVLGTASYMAPEQVRGLPADARSDIFSFGCVLYEMVTGERAFGAETAAEAMTAILRSEPRPVTDLAPDTVLELARVISRCLEKQPDERFQNARDLAFSLRELSRDLRPQPGARIEGRRAAEQSIAVMPFNNLSPDPEDEYFCDGIADEIINALSHIAGLRVAARTSSFSFRGKSVSIHDIGAALSVKTILEGSVRRAGDALRITVQLVNVGDGYQIWSERFDRKLKDVFEIQDEIARTIAGKLQVTLRPNVQERLDQRRTDNPQAYDLYTRGRALLDKRGAAAWSALEAFRGAVALDPDYAAAHAGLAETYTVLSYYGQLPPSEAMAPAKEAVRRSLQVAPDLAEAHNAAAGVSLIHDWDWDNAEREFERALELNPRCIPARCRYSLMYLQFVRARHDDAIRVVQPAVEDDPLSAYVRSIYAYVLSVAGQHDRAVEEARRALQLDPDALLSWWAMYACCLEGGRWEEAVSVARKGLAVSGRHPWLLGALAIAYVRTGEIRKARAICDELVARSRSEYVQAVSLIRLCAELGEPDRAIEHAERAFAERDASLAALCVCWPRDFPLRQDPRLKKIAKGMNLTVP